MSERSNEPTVFDALLGGDGAACADTPELASFAQMILSGSELALLAGVKWVRLLSALREHR